MGEMWTLQSVDDDDAGLWSRVCRGDELALAALFDRHEARLFRHATRLLTHREDAKDAVTVAFFELWRKRASVRLVDGSPLPWLLTAVAHCARNLERSGRRYRTLLERVPAALPAPAPDVDDGAVLGGEENNLTLGVNWYWHTNFKFMANYVMVESERRGIEDNPNVLEFRGQLMF